MAESAAFTIDTTIAWGLVPGARSRDRVSRSRRYRIAFLPAPNRPCRRPERIMTGLSCMVDWLLVALTCAACAYAWCA
ncbi:hypothetical protein ACS0Y7_34470, partial [Burkholderia gladioli]